MSIIKLPNSEQINLPQRVHVIAPEYEYAISAERAAAALAAYDDLTVYQRQHVEELLRAVFAHYNKKPR